MKRIRILLTLLFVVFIFFMYSCADTPSTTLRLALSNFPVNFDLATTNEFFTRLVCENIYEYLAQTENDMLVPKLASNWHFVSNSEIVVELKDDIRFSDGTYLTSDDVVLSIERFSKKMYPRVYEIKVEKSETADNIIHISVVRGARSTNYLTTILSRAPIYKATYITNFDDEFLQKNPMGTGEYFLYSHIDDKIVLKKNKFNRYYKEHKKAPDIVEFYHEADLRTQFLMLRDGKIDFQYQLEFLDYQSACLNNELKVIDKLSYYYIIMALNSMVQYHPDINLPSNPLRDKRVRQAIAHIIDMRTYVEQTLSEKAVLLNMPTLRATRYYPTDLDYYEYDPELSKRLMREAGVEKGFKMRLSSTKGTYSIWLSDYIKHSLAKINIEVIIDYFDGAELYDSLAKSPPSAYIATYSSSTTPRSLHNNISSFLNYDPRGVDNRRNYFKYFSVPINELIQKINQLDESDVDMIVLQKKLAQVVYDEVHIIPFFQPYNFSAMHKDIVWNHKNNNFPLANEFQVKK